MSLPVVLLHMQAGSVPTVLEGVVCGFVRHVLTLSGRTFRRTLGGECSGMHCLVRPLLATNCIYTAPQYPVCMYVLPRRHDDVYSILSLPGDCETSICDPANSVSELVLS